MVTYFYVDNNFNIDLSSPKFKNLNLFCLVEKNTFRKKCKCMFLS